MHATAPGRRVVLHAGQTVVVRIADVRGVSFLRDDLGSVQTLDSATAPAVATAGSKTGSLVIANSVRQAGQRTCLPTALSGMRMVLLQFGHRLICGMSHRFQALALSPNMITLLPTRMRSPVYSRVDCMTRRLFK